MAILWLAAGIGSLVAHMARFDVPSGSPTTVYATLAGVFLGLAFGTLTGRWWPPVGRAASLFEQFPRASAAGFWIVLALLGLWMLRGSAVSGPLCLGAWFGYAVGAGSESSGRGLRRAGSIVGRAAVVRLAVVALLVFAALFGDALLRAVSLDITDTIGDYRQAHVEDALRFRMRLCWKGECLTAQDWACGFTNGDEEAFDRCFDTIVERAAPSIRLEEARKYCGNLTMQFVGAGHSTPEKCQAAGGMWGIKKNPRPLGF